MKKYIVLIICILISFTVNGQKKKEIKANKIKSITIWQADKKDSKAQGFKESFTAYDKEGREIEKTDYNKDGSIKSKETNTYDTYGNKTQETKFNQKDNVTEKKTYKFNAQGDCTEEAEYKDGVLGKKTTCTYNANGDKLIEMVFDGSGNLEKKHVFTYNSKKLKETRQTYNKAGLLESGKQYIYEYF